MNEFYIILLRAHKQTLECMIIKHFYIKSDFACKIDGTFLYCPFVCPGPIRALGPTSNLGRQCKHRHTNCQVICSPNRLTFQTMNPAAVSTYSSRQHLMIQPPQCENLMCFWPMRNPETKCSRSSSVCHQYFNLDTSWPAVSWDCTAMTG